MIEQPLPFPQCDPAIKVRGRGAAHFPAGRFEPYVRVWEHDGWDVTRDEALLRTEVLLERPRTIITRNQSPDIPFDRSINPYRGCEHGCIYCFARPTHSYLGLSPGLDFETKIVAKPDAPTVLARELRKRGYEVAPIGIGTNTDPYQPIEAKMGVMRGVLEVLNEFNHPVMITTRGALILRDLDILSDMATRNLVRVGISVTTLDSEISRKMEPRAPAPQTRLRMIRDLSRAGVPVHVMAAPLIPGLTDHEMEAILTEARRSGARSAVMMPLRLPDEVLPIFTDWLAREMPLRAGKVLKAIAAIRGGALNDARFGSRMTGEGVEADLLRQRFQVSCRRLGLNKTAARLDCTQFRPPPMAGDQLSLF